jgi:hypothetical protein
MPKAKAVNHHYFDELNERSAWLLGLWAADGCVYRKKTSTVVSFAQSNRSLLERVKTELGSEHRISCYAKNGAMTLQFCSTPMAESLCRIFGVDDLWRKSRSLPWPTELPVQLFWHFLRGIVDGDGCYRVSRGQPRLIITGGAMSFLSSISDGIEHRTGVIPAIYGKADGRNYNLTINGVNAAIVSHKMYVGATIYSEAKRRDADVALQWKAERPPVNLSAKTVARFGDLIRQHLKHGPVKSVSGYRQVERVGHQWEARLGKVYLGLHPTKTQAALVRDAAAIGKYGPCAVLNCPERWLHD